MLDKIKNLFREHTNLVSFTMIVRPDGDSFSLSVLPKIKEEKAMNGPSEASKISSFVIKGNDEELADALAGGCVDLIASDLDLADELVRSMDEKKKAIEAAKKATEAAKKQAKDAKSGDPKKVAAELKDKDEEIAKLKKELEEAKSQPSLF